MADIFELTLRASDGSAVTLPLYEAHAFRQRTAERMDDSVQVRSDLDYTFERTEFLESADIFLNDIRIPCKPTSSRLIPIDGERIFRDFYDWVQFSVIHQVPGQPQQEYLSSFVPVMVSEHDPMVDDLHRMMTYVQEHHAFLLTEGNLASRKRVSLRTGENMPLEGRLHLVRSVLDEYRRLYSFFRSSGRFEMQRTPEVMPFNRLRRVEPSTLQYMTTHPELLQPAAHKTPIHWGRQFLEPIKTLVMRDTPSTDIYENRVVCSFLRLVTRDLETLRSDCVQLFMRTGMVGRRPEGYVTFADALQRIPGRTLQSHMDTIDALLDTSRSLSLQYERALGVAPEIMTAPPRGTEIFFHVPQYARVFRMIHQWFTLGAFDLTGTDFFISMAGTSAIYESFVLSRLVRYFEARGWTIQDVRQIQTPHMVDCVLPWGRVLSFRRGPLELRIYQQPVITADSSAAATDGCGLYRNNAYLYGGSSRWQRPQDIFYHPDFVVAISDGTTERFLVMDAKHSFWESVAKYQAAELLFKYVTSLTPVRPDGELFGLAVCCGRGVSDWKVHSMYDRAAFGQRPKPDASWITLNQPAVDAEEEQNAMLDALFAEMMDFGTQA